MGKKQSKLQLKRQELKDEAELIEPPASNEVESAFVMECLAADDEGNGVLFAGLLADQLLYASIKKSWYVWQGNIWRRDRINLTAGLVRYVVERYGLEIVEIEAKIEKSKKTNDPDLHKSVERGWLQKIGKLQAKIKNLRQIRGRNACLEFAREHHGNPFVIEGGEFDLDPWYFGAPNGIIDLRSGLLIQGAPEHLISKQCGCPYAGLDIDMSEWKHFVNTVYRGDQDVIDFIQRLFGYGMTGKTTEHVFPFLLGSGRNGKSLLLASIMRVMGEYAAMIPCELFLKTNQPKNTAQADPAVMKLKGLRLAVASEVEEGSRFSSKNVKTYTGGDVIEGREVYGIELENFKPTHLAVMIGNHEPVPPSGDPAFWDRTYLIKHPVKFVDGVPANENEYPKDNKIEDKLKGMDQQILSWLVEGAVKWQKNKRKLDPPLSVLKATEDYKENSDWIGQYIEACCIRDEEKKTGSTELYTAFKQWYQENINSKKSATPSQRAFGLKLKVCDGVEHKRATGMVYYQGIILNDEWQGRMLSLATKGEP